MELNIASGESFASISIPIIISTRIYIIIGIPISVNRVQHTSALRRHTIIIIIIIVVVITTTIILITRSSIPKRSYLCLSVFGT